MSTQYYAPQQMAPPPAARGARRQKWTPAAGQRHIVGIETIPGRLVPTRFEGPDDVVFDLTDGVHCWYVPQPIADAIYATGIRPGAQIEVTVTGKKRTDLLIIPVQPKLSAASVVRATPAAGGDTTSSREAQSRNGYHPTPPPPPPPPPAQPAVPTPDPSPLNAATACMCSAMCSAVDAVLETQAYATRKGLGLTFSEESVRAIGLSIYISACQGARR